MNKIKKCGSVVGAFVAVAMGGAIMGPNVFADKTYTATDFPDAEFFKCVKSAAGVSYSSESLTQEQVEGITKLQCAAYDIGAVTGLSNLVNLEELSLSSTENLSEVDLSGFGSHLRKISLSNNGELTTLTIGEKPQLENVIVRDNPRLEGLDFSGANKLSDVMIHNNGALKRLSFGEQEDLTDLGMLYDNALEQLDVSGVTKLTGLNASGNQLVTIDLSKNVELKTLTLSNNKLTDIDVSKNKALKSLYAYGNEFEYIDVSKISDSLLNLYLDDNILVRTNFVAKQMRAGEYYYASSETSGDMFIPMIVATRLSQGETTISTEGAAFYKDSNHCMPGNAFCIIIDADILNYQNYVQLKYVGGASSSDTHGRDATKLNYRLEINLEAYAEEGGNNGEENVGGDEENEEDVRVPNTGAFTADGKGLVVGVSVVLLSAIGVGAYLAYYTADRQKSKIHFDEK